MSDMIERVARAIATREAEIMMWSDRSQMKADPRELARAAIEAMREPTDFMIVMGDGARSSVSAQENTLSTWRTMIDEALK